MAKCCGFTGRAARVLISLIAVADGFGVASAGDRIRADEPAAFQPEKQDPVMICSLRLRALSQRLYMYAMQNGDRLAPDLSGALAMMGKAKEGDGAADFAALARANVLSPAHAGVLDVPKDITPEWVNEHSSYAYLGSADISTSAIADWSGTVIAHLRLEHGHASAATPGNPEAEPVFPVAFLDGHVEVMTRTEAEKRINSSKELFTYLRTGKGLSEERLALQQVGTIMRAVHAYAKSHDGKLPPDLGATLAYVPRDSGATSTPAKCARMYLSPRARSQENTFVPDEPTPEWVNQHCWYVYEPVATGGVGAAGSAAISLANIPARETLVLIHGPVGDGLDLRRGDGEKSIAIPIATVNGSAELRPRASAEWIAGESRRAFEAMRANEPLAPWLEASSDVAAISTAIAAYAKANEDRMPPDLAATVPFLPEYVTKPQGLFCKSNPYLSPAAEARAAGSGPMSLEDAARASAYVYLGNAKRTRTALGQAGIWVLVHSPLDESFEIRDASGAQVRVAAVTGPWGNFGLTPIEIAATRAEEARSALAELGKGEKK